MRKIIILFICFLSISIFTKNIYSNQILESPILETDVSIDNKLIFDAKSQKVISYNNLSLTKNDKYLYSVELANFEIIVVNPPKDNSLQIYTIKDINEKNLSFTVEENNKTYYMTKETSIDFIHPIGNDSFEKINSFLNIPKYTKILVYFDSNNNVEKLFITPFKSIAKSIISNKAINIEGKFIEQPPYYIEDKLYLPIRPIAENFGYSIYWDNISKIVQLEKNQNIINIKTNYVNFIKNGNVYVSERFIKNILNVDICLKDNIIYIG
nr:stalk domain-containing protein [uncultured Tyzzerella sp.]